jgi:hypothetical protein
VADWAQTRSQIAVSMYDLDTFAYGIVPPMVGAHSETSIYGMAMENPYSHASVVS